MKWKVKHKNDFQDEYDFLETILEDNGVSQENIKSFIHPTKALINDPLLMKYMKEGIELVHKHVKLGSKIFVKVDCDCDGYCSSAILIQFLKELNPNLDIDYMLNFEKQHGLTYKDIQNHTKDEYGLIIVPDASLKVSDIKQIKNNFSADILVLDHHLIEKEDNDVYTNYCVAINCTDGEYPNPDLSGAGVVQKFIEGYLHIYEEENLDPLLSEKYLDSINQITVNINNQ